MDLRRLGALTITLACAPQERSPAAAEPPSEAAAEGSPKGPSVGAARVSASPDARPLGGSRELAGAIGERVRLVGQAVNAKISAALLVDGEPIYCLELDGWPEGIAGETVEVTGILGRTDQFEAKVAKDGAISQGTAGGDYVLNRCAYHLLTVDQGST